MTQDQILVTKTYEWDELLGQRLERYHIAQEGSHFYLQVTIEGRNFRLGKVETQNPSYALREIKRSLKERK